MYLKFGVSALALGKLAKAEGVVSETRTMTTTETTKTTGPCAWAA